MKKQIKKLALNKKTISNLQPADMNKMIGALNAWTSPCHSWGCPGGRTKNCTQNQNTCPGHNTCQYTCI